MKYALFVSALALAQPVGAVLIYGDEADHARPKPNNVQSSRIVASARGPLLEVIYRDETGRSLKFSKLLRDLATESLPNADACDQPLGGNAESTSYGGYQSPDPTTRWRGI